MVLRTVSIAVLAIAVAVGVVGKFKPTLFLQLPMGFIPWAITGNPMPPFFTADPFAPAEFKTWARDGDLIVSTGVKSGTHWMLYCTHQIRTKGKGGWYDPNVETPWPDMIHRPGQTWAEIKDRMNTTVLSDGSNLKDHWDSPSYPFRIFKSHWFPLTEEGGILPVRENPHVKFLAMVRNGKDMVASCFPHFNAHRTSWRKIWGGFPPPSSPEEVFSQFMPGGTLAHLYWEYVRQWWKMRGAPNVLLLHYSDAAKDLSKTVSTLADFLDVKLSASEHKTVTDKCSIQHMKKKEISANMRILAWGNDQAKDLSFFCGDGDEHCDVPKQYRWSLIRKGKDGEGAQFFSEAMTAQWESVLASELPDLEMREWSQLGGTLPP